MPGFQISVPQFLVEEILKITIALAQGLLHDQSLHHAGMVLFQLRAQESRFIYRPIQGIHAPVDNDLVFFNGLLIPFLPHTAEEELSCPSGHNDHMTVTQQAPGHSIEGIFQFLIIGFRYENDRHLPARIPQELFGQVGTILLGFAVQHNWNRPEPESRICPGFCNEQGRILGDGLNKSRTEYSGILHVALRFPADDTDCQDRGIRRGGNGYICDELPAVAFLSLSSVIRLHDPEGPAAGFLPVK